MCNMIKVFLALVVWFNRHEALPFEIEEWDGTRETVLVVPFTGILWSTGGRMPGVATPRIPREVVLQYEDGTTHRVTWEAFLSLLGVAPPPLAR